MQAKESSKQNTEAWALPYDQNSVYLSFSCYFHPAFSQKQVQFFSSHLFHCKINVSENLRGAFSAALIFVESVSLSKKGQVPELLLPVTCNFSVTFKEHFDVWKNVANMPPGPTNDRSTRTYINHANAHVLENMWGIYIGNT